MSASSRWDLFTGCIAAGAFASGDVVVVGCWRSSPFDVFVDVMWVRPNGERVLLAPRRDVRDYVAALYSFDRAEVAPVAGGWDGGLVAVEAGPLVVRLRPARRDWRSWLFAVRPLRLRRSPTWIRVEDVVARPVVGRLLGGAGAVRAAGTAPGGQRERYGADDWRPLAEGSLAIDGRDAGALVDLPDDLGIGLSAFPRRPALVHVGTLVDGRDGDMG